MGKLNLSDRLKGRIESSSQVNVSLDHLPSQFVNQLQSFCEKERLVECFHEERKGHYIQFNMTPQKMIGYMSVCVDSEKTLLSLDDIMLSLSAAGIVAGVREEEIKKIALGGEFKKTVVGILVAKGIRPTAGKAGFVELLRRPYESRQSEALSKFDPINEDEEIARVHPPAKGEAGVSILGDEEPSPMIKAADYRLNHLVKSLNTGEEISLIAGAKGHIVKFENNISLHEELDINGDLTSNSGTLIYNNHALIRGDIRENTSVNVEGDVKVEGMVSSCQMQVGGDLLIRQGIFGRGASHIVVKGKVSARYINEAYIHCEESITVEKEILNSHIWTKSFIDGTPASLVGGTCFAHMGVSFDTLGSELGLRSLVVVGLDYNEYRIEKEIKPKVESLSEQRDKAVEEFKRASSKMKKALIEHINELNTEIKNLEAEVDFLRAHLVEQNLQTTICIRGGIHPGTSVMIGFSEFEAKEEVKGPVELYLAGESIAARPVPANSFHKR